jgi:hypothetical protein
MAGAGVASAAPPSNPFVEFREPNPVVREFYETEQPHSDSALGQHPIRFSQDRDDELRGWMDALDEVWDLLMDQLTFSLGTAEIPWLGTKHSPIAHTVVGVPEWPLRK